MWYILGITKTKSYNDKIEVFRKFIESYKNSFEYKELGISKNSSRRRKVSVLKQIISIYNIEFQITTTNGLKDSRNFRIKVLERQA